MVLPTLAVGSIELVSGQLWGAPHFGKSPAEKSLSGVSSTTLDLGVQRTGNGGTSPTCVWQWLAHIVPGVCPDQGPRIGPAGPEGTDEEGGRQAENKAGLVTLGKKKTQEPWHGERGEVATRGDLGSLVGCEQLREAGVTWWLALEHPGPDPDVL